MWLLGGIGDALDATAKVTWGAVEKTVQVTKIGEAFEAVGIKVEPGIYEKGLNYKVDNMVLGNHEGKVQARSKGGDFGANQKHETSINGVKIFTAKTDLDAKGFNVETSAGLILSSRLLKMKTMLDFRESIKDVFDQFDQINPVTQLEKAILEAHGKKFKSKFDIFNLALDELME